MTKELNINETGYRMITNIGKDGGQKFLHLPLHIIGGESVRKTRKR